MRGFKNRAAALVVDVAAGGDADAADAGGQSVRDVIAIQVEGGDDAVFGRPGQNLLQERVGNDIFDDDGLAVAGIGQGVPGAAVERLGAVVGPGAFITPVPEGPFREFHDVALVDEGDGFAVRRDRVVDGGFHQPPRPVPGHRLDPQAAILRKADLGVLFREGLAQKGRQLFRLRGAGGKFDAGVDVLRVFAEDHHVDQLRMADGRGHAGEPADRAQADVQVALLADGDIEAADAAADRRGQRPFDTDQVLLEGIQRRLRQPLARLLEGLFAGQDFLPGDGAGAAIRFAHGGIHDANRRPPDVGAGAVAFNVGNHGIIADVQAGGRHGDFV